MIFFVSKIKLVGVESLVELRSFAKRRIMFDSWWGGEFNPECDILVSF